MTRWSLGRHSTRWWEGQRRTPPARGFRLPPQYTTRRRKVRASDRFRSCFMVTDWGSWHERRDRGLLAPLRQFK